MTGNERLSEPEERLIEMLKSVKKSCGQVCDTTLKGMTARNKMTYLTLKTEGSSESPMDGWTDGWIEG